MGFKLEDKQVNHIIWADNIFILARTPLEMQLMMDDVTEALNRVGLRWKHGSPVLLATKNYNEYNTQIYTDIHNTPEFIPLVDQTNILGEMIDYRGNATVTQHHRKTQADKVFWKTYRQLKKEGTKIISKIKAWLSSADVSATYGGENWSITKTTLEQMRT